MLSENQFGFKEKLSKYLGLLKLTNNITEELDKKLLPLAFSGLAKAFDTADHSILLEKNVTIMVSEVQP